MNTKKIAIILTLTVLLCKFLGFIRESLLAYFFGTSYIVDAYLMAVAIPSVAFGWITSIAVVFTPMYAEVCHEKGEAEGHDFFNIVLTDTLLVCVAFLIIGLLFKKSLVQIIAPGFEGAVYELTVQYVKISMFSILFTTPIQLLIAYLNFREHYIQSNLSNLLISAFWIVTVILGGLIDARYLIYGIIAYGVAQIAYLLCFSWRDGLRLSLRPAITPEIKRMLIVILPVFISCMVAELNALVDKSFASNLSEGSVAALNYASQIRMLLFSLFTVAITTISYPSLAKVAAAGDMNELRLTVNRYMRPLLILFIPVTVGAIILAIPLISFVYERGRFSYDDTISTSVLFQMYTLGLLPLVLSDYISRLFYAIKQTKSALYVGSAAVVMNIVLNIILVRYMQSAGLALATSLASWIAVVIGFAMLRKQVGNLDMRKTLKVSLKSIFAAAIMGITVYILNTQLELLMGAGLLNTLVRLLCCAFSGAVVYGIMLLALKVDEMRDVINSIASTFSRHTKSNRV